MSTETKCFLELANAESYANRVADSGINCEVIPRNDGTYDVTAYGSDAELRGLVWCMA